MTADLVKALAKLDRPPSAINWSRLVHDSKPKTTKIIVNFVTGFPQVVYSSGYVAIKDRLNLGIDEATARNVAMRSSPNSRNQNVELVDAFLEYEAGRQYPLRSNIEFQKQWFLISRELGVPVAPLTVLRENGAFLPLFVCGWSDLVLTHGQRRLLMTVIEEAFLSLTDFQGAPAEFLFFPKAKEGEWKGQRRPLVWRRGDYELLSQSQLEEQVHTYLESRDEARTILLARKAAEERVQREERSQTRFDDDGRDLFDWNKTK